MSRRFLEISLPFPRGSICARDEKDPLLLFFFFPPPLPRDDRREFAWFTTRTTQKEREREKERENFKRLTTSNRERLCVASFRGQICTRADLSILITKTSEKKAEIKEGCSRARERERRHLVETILFYTRKKRRERSKEKGRGDEETRGRREKSSFVACQIRRAMSENSSSSLRDSAGNPNWNAILEMVRR